MPSVVYMPSSSDDSIPLGRLLGLLLEYKWLIVISMLLFGLGGMVHANLITPIYQSNVLVQVERRDSVNPIGDPEAMFNTNDGGRVAAEIEILRSRMVLGKVVDRMELDSVIRPHQLPVVGEYFQRQGIQRPDPYDFPVIGSVMERFDLHFLDFLKNNSAVWGGESVQLNRFEVSDSFLGQPLTLSTMDKQRYQLLSDDFVLGEGEVGELESFLGGNIILNVASLEAPQGAKFTLIKISRLDAVQSIVSRLSVSEQGVSGRGVSTGILRLTLKGSDKNEIRNTLDAISETFLMQNVERQSAETQQSLEFLAMQAPDLREKLSSAENRMSEYRSSVDSVDVDTEAQSIIDQFILLEQKLNELVIQEAELAQRFKETHPTYQALLRQKDYLEGELERLDERVNAMPAAQQELIRLSRDVEVAQAIYVNVLNKAQELQLAKAGTIGNVRIIDSAVVESSPVEPRKAMIGGAAAMMGAMLALGYVLLRCCLSQGIESSEQIEEMGFPVYANIPLSKDQIKIANFLRRSNADSVERNSILAHVNATDTAVEALRSLRTSLHFAMLESSNNCIMICGPSPGTGKSFVSLNLAVVCAQAGQRVLIIDADLRRGGLHRAFGGHSRSGLSEVLGNTLALDHALRHTEVAGLDYLSRGVSPPNPSELLMHSTFTQLINEVCDRYDLVIIDTPPVLAVTEAAIVGKRAGTSLMVARFQLNPPREIKLAIRQLENAGVEVKGCILNGMQHTPTMAYGYGYYNYQYQADHRERSLS
ncbi:polysaccharide biosynthesis tyrosine autokinase [Halomonas maura]|uniref:polysaccharide biosynthesis tyrosine autokinase n=1 Tax=Halomonas maura TaxID=117606 RepID=UPI0025B3146C|nr:polysaccharide biosynthesis tyrosine autokinase [Halomonas maura]MDN3555247.1 polysaccharide biosynthesis tyrosine autokinase [Halomonas maura]